MERLLNSSVEKQTIYEIFRACRLCGGGAGYKMPIIQNVVDLEGSDVELKQKIKECVQIEVQQEDKMPPLICELCVDKVNDFYEFLDMCRQTNKHTRLRLGLPPQTMPQGAPDPGDCILGVTEPVYVNDDSDEPLSEQKSKKSKSSEKEDKANKSKPNEKVDKGRKEEVTEKKLSESKKEPELRVKLEKHIPTFHKINSKSTGRFLKSGRRFKSPSPLLNSERLSRRNSRDDISLARLKAQKTVPRVIIAKGILIKETKIDDSLLVPRVKKRLRERTPLKANGPGKKVKLIDKREQSPPISRSSLRVSRTSSITETPPKPLLRSSSDTKISPRTIPKPASKVVPKTDSKTEPKLTSKPDPKPSSKPDPKPSSKPDPKLSSKSESKLGTRVVPKPKPKPEAKQLLSPPPVHKCIVCNLQCKLPQNLATHMKVHTASFTSEKLACNACQEWFKNPEEVAAHHKRHSRGKRYDCTRCFSDFGTYQGYIDHLKDTCIPLYEVPDVQCHECWKYFATDNLRDQHDCPGEDGRPGGKCEHCKRTYATQKSLRNHKEGCSSKKKEFILDPALKSKLRPFLVRTTRCDALLSQPNDNHYDVSNVKEDFGLDKSCIYPFRTRIKMEPKFKGMVKFNDDFEFDGDYIHWDSDDSEDSSDAELSVPVLNPSIKKKKIEKLSTLSLKTIFSHRFLGKVPRKRRKLKLLETSLSVENENIDKISKNLNNNKDYEGISLINNVNDFPEYQSVKLTSAEIVNENIEASDSTVKKNNIYRCNTKVCENIEKENKENLRSTDNASLDNKKDSREEDKIINFSTTYSSLNCKNDEKKININQDNSECKKENDSHLMSPENKGSTNHNLSNKLLEEPVDNSNQQIDRQPETSNAEELPVKETTNSTDQNLIQNHIEINSNVLNDKTKIQECFSSIQYASSAKNESSNMELVQNKNGEIKNGPEFSSNVSKEIVSDTNDNEHKISVESCDIKNNKEKQAAKFEEPENKVDVPIGTDVSDIKNDIDNIVSSEVGNSVNGDQNSPENTDEECDIDMDDRKLMEELDAQIGDNDNNKNVESEQSQAGTYGAPKKDHSMDLDSISDEELNF